jgi:hypothetical protein
VSFLKQSTYYLGLIAGLATIGAAGAVLLTYLFTGRLPAIKMADGEKVKMQLYTPDEIVVLMRQQGRQMHAAQVGGAEAAGQPPVDIGG